MEGVAGPDRKNQKKRERSDSHHDIGKHYTNRIVTAEFLFDDEENFEVFDESDDVDSPLFRADAGVWAPQCFVEPCAWHSHTGGD